MDSNSELLGAALSHHQHAAHSQIKATEQWTSAAEQWDLAAQIKRDQRMSEAPRNHHTAPSPVPASGRKSWREGGADELLPLSASKQGDHISASFTARQDVQVSALAFCRCL